MTSGRWLVEATSAQRGNEITSSRPDRRSRVTRGMAPTHGTLPTASSYHRNHGTKAPATGAPVY